MRHLLITGVTGFIGQELAKTLLASDPDLHLWAIVRPANKLPPQQRPEVSSLLSQPNFHVISGDLALANLGSASETLPETFEACVHVAAMTDFRERNRAETFCNNLEGTRQLIDFCQRLALAKFYHVSTAYVCGRSQGTSYEQLADPPGFFNPYEASKHAAEAVVASSNLNWTILRPSIVVGDSRTGQVNSDKMAYGVLRSYFRLRETLKNKYSSEELKQQHFTVLGRTTVAKNLICVDDVIRLLVMIIQSRPPRGSIFHLTNPHPTTLGEIHRAFSTALGMDYLEMREELPAILQPEEELMQRGIEVYRPYMTCDEPRFDQSALRSWLGDAAVDAIVPASAKLLDFLFQTYVRNTLQVPAFLQVLDGGRNRKKLLKQHGNSTLAYSTLREDIKAFYLPQEQGYLPYGIKGRTAVIFGDPICATEHLPSAMDAFATYCRKHALKLTGIQLGSKTADALASYGYVNRVGDDAILDLADFDLSLPGKGFAQLRRWRNSARAAGVAVKEASYAAVPFEAVEQISRTWLCRKINQRELDLLLRPLPSVDEEDVRKFFAFQGTQLVGLVFFDPIYRNGKVIGYYADLERYAPQPHGIHDLLLLEAIRTFQAEGREILSLGLAPLAGLEDEDHPAASSLTRQLLVAIRDEVGPVYNFTGVSRHKAHYQPRWEPTYFFSAQHDGASDLLDVFSLIGLLPPEAIKAVSDDTFDRMREA
ncbi:MAG: DUF2156 domain-containing protein [Cyanobacteria bacterium NC_groundwater_1444_Ag_S-0.65um_54_12]|nr:DUF2156 domain-containing protein [Cyanobacteria bacterium NC_groundwater_1444_Ag_S-0.65um_54_12]